MLQGPSRLIRKNLSFLRIRRVLSRCWLFWMCRRSRRTRLIRFWRDAKLCTEFWRISLQRRKSWMSFFHQRLCRISKARWRLMSWRMWFLIRVSRRLRFRRLGRRTLRPFWARLCIIHMGILILARLLLRSSSSTARFRKFIDPSPRLRLLMRIFLSFRRLRLIRLSWLKFRMSWWRKSLWIARIITQFLSLLTKIKTGMYRIKTLLIEYTNFK